MSALRWWLPPLFLLLILASGATAKPIEGKAAPIFDCIAATEETVKAICFYQMASGHYPKTLHVLDNTRHIRSAPTVRTSCCSAVAASTALTAPDPTIRGFP